MPSRAAQKAALRRSKEPGVIAPDGVALPELAPPLGWRNPMQGYDFVRDVWELYATHPGGADTLAVVRKLEAGEWSVELRSGPRTMSQSVTDAVAAFTIAVEWGRRQG